MGICGVGRPVGARVGADGSRRVRVGWGLGLGGVDLVRVVWVDHVERITWCGSRGVDHVV